MFYPKRRITLIIGFLFLFSIAIAACSQDPVEVTRVVEVPGGEVEVTRIVEVPGEEVEVTRVVEVEVESEAGPTTVSAVPFVEEWSNSPHADADAEAFVHWDEDDPAEIPERCAKCHSTPGMLDFVGADGSEAGVVNSPAPIGTTVECVACHNDATVNMDTVTFPSGVEVSSLGAEAVCMQCHQGRASTVQVNQNIEEAGLDPVEDMDTVSEDVGFTNIHYYAAAATRYGTVTMGGYEYDGKAYDGKFDHVEGYDTCVDCHNSHTLEVKFDECTACHQDLESPEDLLNIRMAGSLVDYDGDGSMDEGLMDEIAGLQEALVAAMTAYSTEVAGTPIVYDGTSYPYYFADTDGDGAGDDRYASWTPRLAKAAYNYQVSRKDPGEYAHGSKYVIQLLYDSIENLNEALAEPVDMSAMHRIDHGHFAGSEEAFRHWDEEGFVPGSCSKCHSAAGLPMFIEQGVTVNQPTSSGLNCATCHNDLTEFTIYEIESVEFPNGASLSLEEPASNLCLNCHQGRSYSGTVDARIGDADPNAVVEGLSFVNIHYFAAGATLFGSEAQGAYQFADQTYVGQNEHVGGFDSCAECHSIHRLEVEYMECADCHEGVETPEDLSGIRTSETDFDGDGDVEEGIAGEIATMEETLYAAMLDYANNTEGVSPIVYDSHAYPYFFVDTNGNGESDPDEANYGNRYNTWTPSLLRAAYNYQYAAKDPGAFAHNAPYVLQVLYDSINAVGGDTAAMTRPSAPTE